MRLDLEPLLYKYGVDIIFTGCAAIPLSAAAAQSVALPYVQCLGL